MMTLAVVGVIGVGTVVYMLNVLDSSVQAKADRDRERWDGDAADFFGGPR